jgi:hypothetical protein
MPYCLYSVQGSNVLCWAVPQPRPELRFGGPYVLQAPLVHMPNVSSVFLTRDKHMHASSASPWMHLLENMTTKDLFKCVRDMEQELGIPYDQQFESWDMKDDSMLEHVKDILIPKKIEVLEDKIQKLDVICEEWRTRMEELVAGEYQMYNKFEFKRFGPIFFKLVEKTQTCMESMQEKKGFEESLFFSTKLVDSLLKINKKLEIAANMTKYIPHPRLLNKRHWTAYRDAGMDILVSLRGLRTTQEKIIRELTLDSVHLGPHKTIQPMLTTLIQHVQICVNMLLDDYVWNMEQRWMFDEFDGSQKFDFWMLRSNSSIARFSKSLRALIAEMINVLMQKRRQELDTEAEGKHVWTDLLDTLKSFEFPVNLHHTHLQIEDFGTKITFFVLARESNWTVWMRANGIGPQAMPGLPYLVTKMTKFCSFFIKVLNGLHKNTHSWSEWTSKICQEYSDAMANSNVLDNLRKIE